MSKLIERLDCRQTGKDQWLARCPAHGDKSPSLSIKELSDGRTLIHCFAGCEVEDIVNAVGLNMSDLFPDDLDDYYPREKRRAPPMDVLRALKHEIRIAQIGTQKLLSGTMTDDDITRLKTAAERIQAGFEYVE